VDRKGIRYAHTWASLVAAAEHPEVSDEFYLFNDDFFVMHPGWPGTFYRGQIANGKPQPSNHYSRARHQIGEWLREKQLGSLDYDMHVPMVMNKVGVLEMAARPLPDPGGVVFKRSVYGNLFDIGGHEMPDPKVRDPKDGWDPGAPFLSTNDHTFRRGVVGRHIRETFVEPSPYEVVE
jgi:hypothetical protein